MIRFVFLFLVLSSAGGGAKAVASEEAARNLVNKGWAAFVGRDGSVSELDALRLIGEGVRLAKDRDETVYSVGMNNLSVVHMCAAEASVRDYDFGRKLQLRQLGKNSYTNDNYLWAVFLREENLGSISVSDYYGAIKEGFKTHPINRYSIRLNQKLPNSREHALQILVDEAKKGDPYAAQRIAFSYECSRGPIKMQEAILWYEFALELMRTVADTNPRKISLRERLNRLKYLSKN